MARDRSGEVNEPQPAWLALFQFTCLVVIVPVWGIVNLSRTDDAKGEVLTAIHAQCVAKEETHGKPE